MNKIAITSIILLSLLFLLALGVAVYIQYTLYEKIEEKDAEISELESELSNAQHDNMEMAERLRDKEEEVQDFYEQISELTGDVGLLMKLEETDEELLKKYSRVYFLNEHYTPPSLKLIDHDFVYRENEVEEIHGEVKPFLEDMLFSAEDDGIDMRVISAYRSFDEQSTLKSHYTVTYGAGANQFSADQGYSEHQLGTAVDFTTRELGENFTTFANTKAYEWMLENAHRFGFILSYPEGNEYYIFEPWHWRFVGVELATNLYEKDTHFYDMPQREIDEYLVKIFD